MSSFETWLKGLLAAVISSAASAASLILVDPEHFNPLHGGFRDLGLAALVSAVSGAVFYLKQSPVPNGTKKEPTK